MSYVQPPSGSGFLRRAAVIGVVVLAGWSLATAGAVAYAADDKPGNSGDAPGQNKPEVGDENGGDEPTPTTTIKPSTPTTVKPDRPRTTTTTIFVPPVVKVSPEPQKKTIIRKYVMADRPDDHRTVATPTTTVATPEPVATDAPVAEVPVVEETAPLVEPSAEATEEPAELALAEAASTSESVDMSVIWMLAGALAVAIVGLGASMLLFNRMGSAGTHGRAIALPSFGGSAGRRFATDEPVQGVVTSADLLEHTGRDTGEIPVVDLTSDTGEVPVVDLSEETVVDLAEAPSEPVGGDEKGS